MNAEQFNELYPIGTPVTYTDDFGKIHETTTISEAWDLGSGDTVVSIHGRSGGHDITRIKKRTEDTIKINVPLERVQDIVKEKDEEIARLREALFKIKNICDSSEVYDYACWGLGNN